MQISIIYSNLLICLFYSVGSPFIFCKLKHFCDKTSSVVFHSYTVVSHSLDFADCMAALIDHLTCFPLACIIYELAITFTYLVTFFPHLRPSQVVFVLLIGGTVSVVFFFGGDDHCPNPLLQQILKRNDTIILSHSFSFSFQWKCFCKEKPLYLHTISNIWFF